MSIYTSRDINIVFKIVSMFQFPHVTNASMIPAFKYAQKMYMSSPPTKKINVRYCFWKNVIAYVKMATTCNVIENTRETKIPQSWYKIYS